MMCLELLEGEEEEEEEDEEDRKNLSNTLRTSIIVASNNLGRHYKKRHSTSHAIHTLKNTVNYFTSRGSNVFAAILDSSKGFDKVNHSGIFIKLIKRGVPLCFLNLSGVYKVDRSLISFPPWSFE